MPGGRLDDNSAASDKVTSMAENNTILIIHASTNDVINTKSEELLEKYRKRIRRYKCKSNKIILSGILLRSSAPIVVYNRVFSTINRLMFIFIDKGINLIIWWNDLYNKPFLFQER